MTASAVYTALHQKGLLYNNQRILTQKHNQMSNINEMQQSKGKNKISPKNLVITGSLFRLGVTEIKGIPSHLLANVTGEVLLPQIHATKIENITLDQELASGDNIITINKGTPTAVTISTGQENDEIYVSPTVLRGIIIPDFVAYIASLETVRNTANQKIEEAKRMQKAAIDLLGESEF